MTQLKNEELTALTSIRFFAALLIFFYHVHSRWPLGGPQFLANIFSQGAVGMSLFFILSGFILTYTYHGRLPHSEYSNFFVRRFARIYPVFFVSAILAVPWLVPIPPVKLPLFPEPLASFAQYLFVIGADLSLMHAWFPALFEYWNNGLTWSLSVEAVCYAAFPLALLVLSQLNRLRLFVALGVAYVLSVAPGLSWYLFDTKPSPPFALLYALPVYRLPEFVVGMIVGILFIRKSTGNPRDAAISLYVITAALLTGAYLGYVGESLLFYVSHNFLIVPSFALIIYWCAQVEGGPLNLLLGNRLLRFFGKSSYSFYLMQFFPIQLTKQFYDTISTQAPLLRHNWILALVMLFATMVLAAASYRIIELPARRYIRAKYQNANRQR